MSRIPSLILLIAALGAAACSDSPTDPTYTPSLGRGKPKVEMEIWSPVEGERLSGEVQFRARVVELAPDRYSMTWQVDGGEAHAMTDAYEGGAHKSAAVDVAGWSWSGAGPYTVTFVARDAKGRRLASRSVNVSVDPVTSPPPSDTTTSQPATNPFAGATLYVDPYSKARRTADEWYAARPADAAEMEKIASQPQAKWFGDWYTDVRVAVSRYVSTVVSAGALPVLVVYNIPIRDCAGYSGGGASSPDAYRHWIREFAGGLGGHRAAVILEPDALAGMDCLSAADQQTRIALLSDAVLVLKQSGAVVYVDAGNARWHSASAMAERVLRVGTAMDGFALNVSNFLTNSESALYGEQISALLGGKHFVIDTSRNGLGYNGEWCNPDGRALGTRPTASTGHPLVDAFVWIKAPGESDGTCNGGPSAGTWWPEYALGLARRAPSAAVASAR